MELVLIAGAGIGGLTLAAADVLPERVERIVPWPEQQRASHPGDRSRPVDTPLLL